ncbi:hypothetical protein G9A89_004540 [Geosiphon pyriformis]|nr:hypothetical protein G9A89_004540 [Geosiphon pyriformis]
MGACIGDNKEWPTATKYYCRSLGQHANNVPGRGGTCNKACQYTILINDWNTWKRAFNKLDASTKAKSAMPEEIREIKDNFWTPKYNEPNYSVDNFFMDDPDAFQNQYQELVPTQKEQEQRLADLNTKLCDHCLILCYFQYCNKCDLMFNLLPRILFSITKLPESEEKEVLITKNMSFQDPTEDTETEHLAKKKINIKEGIIDAGYIENIIMMLQNNLDRPYKIELQEKIVQAIFLPLVKIPQLTLVTI